MIEQLKAEQRGSERSDREEEEDKEALVRPSWERCQQALAEARYYDALLEAHFRKERAARY